ncbi:restriction endonuclease subunit S [Staphylococcus epidermidis]|nr:restriction endonuclease subunit S [Staphylococcus epidermidis]MCG1884246.1 restriction endonuclease subunit S [Staphylococcus epidermidis]
MTEQTNTPGLRFPEFSENWEIIKVRDLSKETIGGGTPNTSKSNYWKGELNWIQSSDLSLDNLFKHRSKKYINDKALNNSSAKKIPANSIAIVSRVGVGKLVYINHEYATSQDFINLVHLNYPFKFIMYSLYLLLKGEANKLQGTSIKGITKKDLLNYSLNIPKTIEEQEKIGVFFNKLDRQIELEEEKLELLEQQKRGYMQKIFSQELRFKDDNGNEYPEWQFKNLGELGESFTGLSGKTKDDFGYGDGLFITYMNVFKNTIAKSNMVERVKIGSNENQNRVQYGDILFTTSSEVPNEVGMSSIWLFNQDNVYLNSFCFGFRIVVNYIKPVYLARYLRSEEMRKTITILAQGSTRFNISKKEMMKLNIKVPYIEEQNKIDNFFNKIDKYIEKQSEKIELLKERKKGLLQKMFV